MVRERALTAKLSTVGGLVKTIVPQARAVAIFDRQGQVVWATDAEDYEELRLLASDLITGAESGGPSNTMRCVLDAAASYAFVMREPGGALAGALTLTIAGPFRRANLLLPTALEARLAPLLRAGPERGAPILPADFEVRGCRGAAQSRERRSGRACRQR